MKPQALLFIESKIQPLIQGGRVTNKLIMYVPSNSELLIDGMIQTKFGPLRVKANAWLTKGCSYIMGEGGQGFCWVKKRAKEDSHASQ